MNISEGQVLVDMGHKNLMNTRLPVERFNKPPGHTHCNFLHFSSNRVYIHLLCKLANTFEEIVYQLTNASHKDTSNVNLKKCYHLTCQSWWGLNIQPTWILCVHESCMIIKKSFMIFLSLWATITLAKPNPALRKTQTIYLNHYHYHHHHHHHHL